MNNVSILFDELFALEAKESRFKTHRGGGLFIESTFKVEVSNTNITDTEAMDGGAVHMTFDRTAYHIYKS